METCIPTMLLFQQPITGFAASAKKGPVQGTGTPTATQGEANPSPTRRAPSERLD